MDQRSCNSDSEWPMFLTGSTEEQHGIFGPLHRDIVILGATPCHVYVLVKEKLVPTAYYLMPTVKMQIASSVTCKAS